MSESQNPIECADGTREWFRDGKLHRDGGKPAVEYANGNRMWYRDGELKRESFVGWTAIYQDEERGYTLHRSRDGRYRAGCYQFPDANNSRRAMLISSRPRVY